MRVATGALDDGRGYRRQLALAVLGWLLTASVVAWLALDAGEIAVRVTVFLVSVCVLVALGAVALAVVVFRPPLVRAREDIELTWRLQLAGREVVYEPAALFGMLAPETLRSLWRQRLRWVVGLAQVLRRHLLSALKPANWRMWPVLLTGGLSIVWAHALVGATVVLTFSGVFGGAPPEILPFLALFGAITVLAGILQAAVGIWLDRRYDPAIARQFPWAPWFPLCYWVLCVLLVVRGTLPGLWRRPRLAVWNVPREEYEAARVGPG